MNEKEYVMVCANEEAVEVAVASIALKNLIDSILNISKQFDKALRFGPHEINPITIETGIQTLVYEINDFYAALELLEEHGIELKGLNDRKAIDAKKEKIKMFVELAKKRQLIRD